ncbi:MAG: hypothetical protein EZS28_008569 [Streblomastix strix]|uniref:Uncharacterized protein n=1 Tax=Streblomastix strix TaxID=222440 RepID=A0A5J4WNY0_9EUKA|nr:MAG: hypothetical protein EZS28_008569 [Streblomastix strix]
MIAVFDGIYDVLIINDPFKSIQQNTLFLFVVFVPTNAITLSPAFGLAYSGQLLNKYPLGNNPVVSYDTVNVIQSPYTINYGSDPPIAKKLDRSSYELKSNFVGAFDAGGTNSSLFSDWYSLCWWYWLLKSFSNVCVQFWKI